MTTDFGTLGVPFPLLEVLASQGKTTPFPIQTATLPDTLAGRDVLGRGRTGSGKTLAFGLPLVARLGTRLAGGPRRPGRPLGLVLAPTRELATQIAETIAPLAKAYGLSVTTIFGGVSQNPQVAALRSGVDIVVACPGRLEDLMKQGHVRLDRVEITVLDEADHMADLGFLDNGVDKLVRRYLHNQVLHSVDEATSHVSAMTHHVFEVSAENKPELVRTLASGTGRRILFMRTKHHAKKLAKQLTESGIPAVDLHGNLSQPQRDRNLAAFSSGDARVLVATDVAARGVHVDNVELVVHVDPPMEHKAYLHRSGRTARAGSEGDVVTVMLPAQRGDTQSLLRKAAIAVTPQQVTPTTPAVTALVGEVAPYVKPAPAQPRQQQGGGGRSQGANAQRKRAARDGASTSAPRRDRSGRPAQSSGGRSGAPAGSGRAAVTGERRSSTQPHAQSSHAQPARAEQAPSRPRGGNGRAQSSGGPIRVGQVVRPNVSGGQRRGR